MRTRGIEKKLSGEETFIRGAPNNHPVLVSSTKEERRMTDATGGKTHTHTHTHTHSPRSWRHQLTELLPESPSVSSARLIGGWNKSRPFQCNFRAVSEQFQSSFKLISEQFQSNLRAVSEQFQVSFRSVSEQFQGSFRAISGRF